MPAGTVPVIGAALDRLFKDILGGKNPLVPLSSSSNEFGLMVFGLSPILTWAVRDITAHPIIQNTRARLFMFIVIYSFEFVMKNLTTKLTTATRIVVI